MMVVLTIGALGWVWAISVDLHEKLLPNIPLNITYFKIIFSIPIVYSLIMTCWISYIILRGGPSLDYSMGLFIGVILILHMISMICIVLGIRFAAKTLKSVELGRHARFNDYVGEFFLIWFSIIGVWILQPRINKLTERD